MADIIRGIVYTLVASIEVARKVVIQIDTNYVFKNENEIIISEIHPHRRTLIMYACDCIVNNARYTIWHCISNTYVHISVRISFILVAAAYKTYTFYNRIGINLIQML